MSNSNKAYEVITDRILSALEQNIVPWHKPWSLPAGIRPQNVSGHVYTGINTFMLGMSGYSDPRWLTYRKATELGGHVKRGEKGTPIVFVKPLTVERENYPVSALLFGVQRPADRRPIPTAGVREFDAIEAAEAIIAGMPNPPSISHDGGDRAYYRPATDEIHLPPRQAFADSGEYYSTAFHELGHSTGHSSRLDRHELVQELG